MIEIRAAVIEDCPALLELMRGLAEFEGYLDQFTVTLHELKQRGFPESGKPEFHTLVAGENGGLSGMLVYYFIPFTFDLRPTLFIKELFVAKQARGKHIGEALFTATREEAEKRKCGCIKWDVLHDNHAAQRFYERQGAKHDVRWLGYKLEL